MSERGAVDPTAGIPVRMRIIIHNYAARYGTVRGTPLLGNSSLLYNSAHDNIYIRTGYRL